MCVHELIYNTWGFAIITAVYVGLHKKKVFCKQERLFGKEGAQLFYPLILSLILITNYSRLSLLPESVY